MKEDNENIKLEEELKRLIQEKQEQTKALKKILHAFEKNLSNHNKSTKH